MKTLTDHWNKIFQKTDEQNLGWHESDYSQTLKLLSLVNDWENAKFFIPGVGTSGLIDTLSKFNTQLILNDISPAAIEKTKQKFNAIKHDIIWLCQDISAPLPTNINDIDIWIDRAVLHFLTDDHAVDAYFKNVHYAVKPGGYALFAEFSKTGSNRCAGLDVKRYNVDDLKQHLPSFKLVTSDEYTYINPNGAPRPYVYALFVRTEA